MTTLDPNRALVLERPLELHFGSGRIDHVGAFATKRGVQRTLVIAAPVNRDRVAAMALPGKVSIFDEVVDEPDLAMLALARGRADSLAPDLIVGFGGGSAMDLAKLVAVLTGHDLPVEAIIGSGRAPRRQVALAQVPTTAGTGSEAGPRALVTDVSTGAKLAAESPHMMADLAVIDPELAITVPPAVTAETGIDALAHCVEAFTNVRAHPMVDLYAREGMRLIGRYLRRAVEHGADVEARAGLALAALYGGYCLGPVNTAGGHALAYPLSTQHGLPHGRANAIIFPHVLAHNAASVPDRTLEVGRLLGFSCDAAADVRAAALRFCADLGIAMRLSDHGIDAGHIDAMVIEAVSIRRLLDNNPSPLTQVEIADIYRAAL